MSKSISEVLNQQETADNKPVCPHFGECGGCLWQDIPYSEQLDRKEKVLSEGLRPFLGDMSIKRTVPAVTPWRYRNKMEFVFGVENGHKILGLHKRGSFRHIVNLDDCLLASGAVNSVRNFVRDYFDRTSLDVYNTIKHEGFLRYLIIREGKNTGEILVILVTYSDTGWDADKFTSELTGRFPEICGVLWAINSKISDTARAEKIIPLYGTTYFHDKIEKYTFRISPYSFFQPNTAMVPRLVQLVTNELFSESVPFTLDLYSGIGTLSMFLAERAPAVAGLEIENSAVEDARHNAQENGIQNCLFYCADVREIDKILSGRREEMVAVIDPSRSGIGKKTIRNILKVYPRRMVYVSCNWKALLEDLRWLTGAYRIESVSMLDMFPQTPHMECALVLRSK
jgi:23S rRNA (uracil-5-)-methyltransferase RumA